MSVRDIGLTFGVSRDVTAEFYAFGTRLAYLALCGR
jgi:hypothetical protein